MYIYICIYIHIYVQIHIHIHIYIYAYVSSDSVLSKTAVFPKKEGRKREISDESTRGWPLREANV